MKIKLLQEVIKLDRDNDLINLKEKIGKMADSSLEEAFNLHREIFLEEFKNEDYLKSTKTFDELINRVNSFILGNKKEFYLHIPRDIFNIDKRYFFLSNALVLLYFINKR